MKYTLHWGKRVKLKLNTNQDWINGFNCYNCEEYIYTKLFWNEKQNLQYQCEKCKSRWD